MKKFLALALAIVFSSCGFAAVREGENLLVNGAFDAEQVEFPEFWSRSSSKAVLYERTGGPEGGKPAVILRGDGVTAGTVSCRQQGMTLVAGEVYKLSAYIKTRGFASRHAGLVVHNSGWVSDVGFKDLPADSDWTFMERTFTLFESKDREYGVAMFAVGLTGEIHFADLKFEAVSEGARQGSKSQMSIIAGPRLVPVQPLLSRIPLSDPGLTFRVFGTLPDGGEACECVVGLVGDPIARQTFGLEQRQFRVNLAGLSPGEYSLEAVLRHRDTGEIVIEAAYPIRIIDQPVVDRSGIRQLNNLVAEVLNRPLADSPARQQFTFPHPRDGWVLVACVADTPSPDLRITLGDQDIVITAATARGEAFRHLPMGEHRIAVTGNTGNARLLVRSIPEIFNYPPCVNSFVRENGDYDWDFMKEHILHAVTTLNGGRLPGEALEEAKAAGLLWLANFNVAPVDDPEDVRQRMEKHAGMTQPQYDGLTSDELFFGRTNIDHYTKALWRLHNPDNRLIYTWIVGKPSIHSLHTDFMSAALNVSGGRGRLLFEAYCRPQLTEQAAAAYLDNMVVETMRRFNEFLPNAAAGTGMIFGNFNQIPIISLEHHPGVDFKYFLDMQVNLIANDPQFEDLATTGYWGTYYGDEELVRWSFKLMRHYAVEGNRDMLSARYGFTYNPGFLNNPDLTEGLDGWELAPAGEGTIRAATVTDYGKNSQRRWGGGNIGDTVCIMTRQADQPNRMSQMVEGLQPGKLYCLQFVTADFRDVTGKVHNPRRYGIDVELDGVEILTDRGFIHIDKRNKHSRLDPAYLGKINLNRIVFRATAPTLPIVFHDTKAEVGEELMVNFIQLKPYFLEEPAD